MKKDPTTQKISEQKSPAFLFFIGMLAYTLVLLICLDISLLAYLYYQNPPPVETIAQSTPGPVLLEIRNQPSSLTNITHRLVYKLEADKITAKINEYAAAEKETLLVSYSDLAGNDFNVNGETEVRSASVIKVLVMIEVYTQIEDGQITMGDHVYRYEYCGSVAAALSQMMHYSNNAATGALIKHVGGVEVINKTIRSYLGDDIVTYIGHTPTYQTAEGAKEENVTTTDEQIQLMQLLYKGEVINKERSQEMIALMSGCLDYFGVRNIQGLEILAMKTGYFPDYLFGLSGIAKTDSGSFVFSIYTDDWTTNNANWTAVKTILQKLTEFHNGSAPYR